MEPKSRPNKKRTAHIVSHSHWDREWRYPIWETRLMLIKFMDELIEVLESDRYPGFLLDGQIMPILDYLQICPEKTERVKALISTGKLEIGPWLLLPDEYPVDGEALIRNLLWGRRKANQLGGCFNVGYTAFGWGQTSQLPQIYAGFGIDVAMIGKRVGNDRAPNCEFLWRSPDGTEILTTRFGHVGRQNFYFTIHLPALFGMNYSGADWIYPSTMENVLYHRADKDQMEQDFHLVNPPGRWFPDQITPERIEAAWQTTEESLLDNDRLMMNGCDYSAAQPMFHEMLKRIVAVDSDQNREWTHTTMTAFLKVMKSKIDRTKLVTVNGELRDGPAALVTGNALASRLYLKALNKYAQNMLIRFAEPFSAIGAFLGLEYPDKLMKMAWGYLLESHPHDSINGVAQDKTVEDVKNRLQQVVDIAQTLGNRTMQELTKQIDTSGFSETDNLIIVFNPLPYPRREVVEAWINTPGTDLRSVWCGEPLGVRILNSDNSAVSTQCKGCTDEVYPVAELHTRVFPYKCSRYQVFFDAGQIPACGYKVFRVCRLNERKDGGIEHSDSLSHTSSLLKRSNVLENEYLRVEMNQNGTFDLVDKENGKTYRNLNYYEDRGENGDYWINNPPLFDKVYNSLSCAARMWSEVAGPLQTTLVSEITMALPQRGIKEQHRRGDALSDLMIRTAVTLRAGSRQVDVYVEFENRHQDHCLRVLFPTGLTKSTHADAGGHFIVDRRPIRPQGPTSESVWRDMATLPQNNFIDVSDGEYGIAFLNDSLTEYEVSDNPDRIVALSLLRSVHNWICTGNAGSFFPSQKGGQCLGNHSFKYAIYPHAGDWKKANIPLAAEQLNVPLRLVQTNKHPGVLPVFEKSFFEIDNSMLRFSTFKKSEDRDTFIVRIYNPTDENQAGSIKFSASVAYAWETNLNEDRKNQIYLTNSNVIPVLAGPYKIVTIEIGLKS